MVASNNAFLIYSSVRTYNNIAPQKSKPKPTIVMIDELKITESDVIATPAVIKVTETLDWKDFGERTLLLFSESKNANKIEQINDTPLEMPTKINVDHEVFQ